MTEVHRQWVPPACTLPTAEQPLRLQEFDDLFAAALRSQGRISALVLRWVFDNTAEPTLRALTDRETACCSFLDFDFSTGADGLRVDVSVPAAQIAALDAVQARSATRIQR